MSYKGKYNLQNPKKYVGDPTNIRYRSLWERRFMVYCDTNKNIVKWGSEEVVIPYRSPLDGKIHRYFVDFIIESKSQTGETKVSLIEIKPKKQCKEPIKPQNPSKKQKSTYIYEAATWSINQEKWNAAKNFAKERGWEFVVLTEDDIF
jgi:hypothetical protein